MVRNSRPYSGPADGNPSGYPSGRFVAETRVDDLDKDEQSAEDLAPKKIYPAIARAMMGELHANLLEVVSYHLRGGSGKNLLVLGPGSEVLPFSEHLDDVGDMINGGDLILQDYNETICRKMKEYLEGKKSDRLTFGDAGPGQARVIIRHQDVRAGLAAQPDSLDAIDMTVSVHHATQYENDLIRILADARRVLKKNGLLHIGEGNVDMKYSERKLERLVKDVSEITGTNIELFDRRNGIENRRQLLLGYLDLGERTTILVNEQGMVELLGVGLSCSSDRSKPNEYEVAEALAQRGYKQMIESDHSIFLPLIDHAIEDDFQGLIVPVRKYYAEVSAACLKNLAPEDHEAFRKAISKEQSDAERGLVEYYSPPSMVEKNLQLAGFRLLDVRYTEQGPFVNYVAVKTDW